VQKLFKAGNYIKWCYCQWPDRLERKEKERRGSTASCSEILAENQCSFSPPFAQAL